MNFNVSCAICLESCLIFHLQILTHPKQTSQRYVQYSEPIIILPCSNTLSMCTAFLKADCSLCALRMYEMEGERGGMEGGRGGRYIECKDGYRMQGWKGEEEGGI